MPKEFCYNQQSLLQSKFGMEEGFDKGFFFIINYYYILNFFF